MGVREKLQAFPQVTTVVAVLAIVVSSVLVYFHFTSDAPLAGRPAKFFFSLDDGKTFFVGPTDPLPPFEQSGKTVYRASVFTCDGGRTQFVGYLERYSDRAKTLMQEMWKREEATRGPPAIAPELLAGIEIKRPGDTAWVPQSDVVRAARILDVRCPTAPNTKAEIVFP